MSTDRFNEFRDAVNEQFKTLAVNSSYLFRTQVDTEDLWFKYLNSFPPGRNVLFRERTEHDCQCCKNFIRDCGSVVAIKNGKMYSIWDIETDSFYQEVADAMSEFVKSYPIDNVFVHYQKSIGNESNISLDENNDTEIWSHFYFDLPNKFVRENKIIGTYLSESKSTKEVFQRGMEELTLTSAEIVLELIDQKSLYKGEEYKYMVETFRSYKEKYNKMKANQIKKDLFCWSVSTKLGLSARFRNTAIGTLLTDISDNVNLEDAVKSFETKVAPQNYKRTSAPITKTMISNARKKIEEIGAEESLSRRFAKMEDLTINNVLFANRDATTTITNKSVWDEMETESTKPISKKDLSKIEEIGIDDFIKLIPKLSKIEILFENRFSKNLMSLAAPQNKDAKNIFKWGNNFSWAYNGDVTDSLKERVKTKGGNVNGVLRCSLGWYNYDDLDIHVIEPMKNEIYFARKVNQRTSGELDVDMNAGYDHSRNAVENITWTDESKMQEGTYRVFINQYNKREMGAYGFVCEIEYNGIIHKFHYDRPILPNENVEVAKFKFTRKNGIEFISHLPKESEKKIDIWGLKTNTFHDVSIILNSPNYWDDQKIGNKHWFFILKDCLNPDPIRGFFNEYLSNDLVEHRKVFEILGSKMMCEKSNDQLSGLGFSSTKRDHFVCKVRGSFNRQLKVVF